MSRVIPRPLFAALLIALLWSGLLAVIFPYHATDDALEYDRIAQNLATGHGFSLSTVPPFVPTMYREPVYPLLLSGVFRIAGHRYGAAQAAQIGLFLLTVLLVYHTASMTYDARIAQMAALCTALAPPLANFPSYLLSETLFTCLLIALVWALVKTVSSARVWWYVLVGFLGGMLVLCKAIAVLFVVPIIVVWMVSPRCAKQIGFARRMGRSLVFLVSACLVVCPWIVRNQQRFGSGTAVALRGGRAIWQRAQQLEQTPVQVVQTMVFSMSEFLGKALFPTAVDRPRDFLLRASGLSNQRMRAWEAEGMSPAHIDQRFLEEGLQAIRAHPVRYLAQSGLEWLKMAAFIYLPVLNEPRVEDATRRVSGGRLGLAMLRGGLHLSAFAILIFAYLGAWVTRVEWERWLFIALPVVVLTVAYSLLSAYGRFAVPLVPLYLILACAGWRTLQERHAWSV